MSPLPQDRYPTPDEWVAAFLSADSQRRRDMAAAAIANRQEAGRCYERDHEGYIAMLEPRQRGNALAQSILNHRTFCTDCGPHVSDALDALNGASIEDILAKPRAVTL